MKVTKTEIPGLLIVQPDVFNDSRGYFFESYNKNRYKEFEISDEFVQDNISKSSKSTVRGLHYQVSEKAQGKLCQVIEGEVLDVAVDIRFGSPTFGKHFSLILNSETKFQLWIPEGFAHGFSVLSDEAIFSYKCSNYYSKEHERSIIYNDSGLNIDWKVEKPIVSEKDLKAPKFKDIEKENLHKLAQKKYVQLINRNLEPKELKVKLTTFLLSKGFEYELVKTVCNNLLRN